MDKLEVLAKLNNILELSAETEWVEFKHAKQDFPFDKIGKYFSALSNEANLNGKECGWLVFGVDDKTKNARGSDYRAHGRRALDSLKKEIADKTTNRITFVEIYELEKDGKRIIMFQIPPAPQGMPVAWEGHYYGREGESLAALSPQEYEAIRNQAKPDWSAQICDGAAITHLDSLAITKARDAYKIRKRNPVEIDNWDETTFLNKAKLTVDGKVTRAAIILLGKPESTHFLSPAQALISWFLRDEHNNPKDFEHFGPPFIVTVDAVLAKIRNLTVRFLPPKTLFPIEATQYDQAVIREALHNCVAHQDYTRNSRINVVEFPDEVLFENTGNFIPGSVEAVIEQNAPQREYRNPFLAQAMVNLGMIETEGGGIKEMFTIQRRRFFPLPTYELDKPDEVKVHIPGKIIDENYTRLLITNAELDLRTVILLDKVQKKRLIAREEHTLLKKKKFVEGRYPNLFVSAGIADITGKKAEYIRNRPFDNDYYKQLVIKFLKKYGSAARKDINELLFDKLSDVLNDRQKNKKIDNLLHEMAKKNKVIRNIGSFRFPKWVLNKNNQE